jgi:MoaA/NifB/PqqE/SkfB family radical SAM enzyme
MLREIKVFLMSCQNLNYMYKITSRWPHQDSIHVEWNLGKRCNYDCSYCPSAIHDNYSPHTDINILEKAVDSLCEIGKPIRISLTGGEPCVHPEIEDLLDYFKRKEISWVNITTNGTRGYRWYLNNEMYFNHLVFSLHFEQNDWHRIFDTIMKFYDSTERDFFVNVMAHHDYIPQVKTVVKKFKDLGIRYAVRRIRWTEGDHNIFDDMRYDGNDLEWLISQEATANPNCIIDNDDTKIIHANDIIKKKMNNFKGWTCNIGLESLMINWDGEVHRATCRVGGSLGNIYNGTFVIPDSPVVCSRDWCTCAADIPITKQA